MIYPNWLTNVVVVPKKNEKWSQYWLLWLQYKQLSFAENKPAKGFDIGILYLELHGCLLGVQSDCYVQARSRRNILRHWWRVVLSQGNALCLKKMPTQPTRYRLQFRKYIRGIMEEYINGFVVKSLKKDHINHLEKSFVVLCHYTMKLIR